MEALHIAEVGELFGLDDGFDFLSDQNMLEYDFIVIDSESLIEELTDKLESRVAKRFKDLKDFVAKKNIPVIFFCSSENDFVLSERGRMNVHHYLEIEAEEEPSSGKKIEVNNQSHFSSILKKYQGDFEYVVGFTRHPGTSLGNAKAKPLSIGFYTKDFVFFPTITEYSSFNTEELLKDLYEICRSIRSDHEQIQLPVWTKDFLLPGEKDEMSLLRDIEANIAKLEAKKQISQDRLNTFVPLKQLWTATGVALENAAKMVFMELGFTLLPTEPGRDDIIMKWGDQIVIVEVKGQSKSAAEKHAAQLEKWLSTYMLEYEIEPKGLLLVNTYREHPLSDRSQISFPDQMLAYSERRGHCLATTVQLCNLLLYCRANPSGKEEEIIKLINTVGKYEKFDDWNNYIEYPQAEKITVSKRKRK